MEPDTLKVYVYRIDKKYYLHSDGKTTDGDPACSGSCKTPADAADYLCQCLRREFNRNYQLKCEVFYAHPNGNHDLITNDHHAVCAELTQAEIQEFQLHILDAELKLL